MSEFTTIEDSRGLKLDEVSHIIIPGRGRNETADGLSPESAARALQGARLFGAGVLGRLGVVVPSGYKTPSDTNGGPWRSPLTGEIFQGTPEAYAIREVLLDSGVPDRHIRVEAHSIDTVTNFARIEAEGFLPDDEPVAIVAQSEHLERIIDVVAPRTLRREYLGVVVPESGEPDHDGRFNRLASRAILFGISPTDDTIVDITTERATRMWTVVNATKRRLGMSTEYPPKKALPMSYFE